MIPAGFEGFADGLKDPLGLSRALSEVDEVEISEHATMVNRFGEQGEQAAFAYLLFILIYAPCVAALAAIHREIGLGWMLLAVSYLTGLAWMFMRLAVLSDSDVCTQPGCLFRLDCRVCGGLVALCDRYAFSWKPGCATCSVRF